jgi:CHRD domain
VDAGVADSPPSLARLGIRGQLVQGYKTSMSTAEEVDDVEENFVGSGVAKVWFEEAGKMMCIDATIVGFDPVVAHLHKGDFGENGVLMAVLSSKKKSPGRFLGCGELSQLRVDSSQRSILAADFLEYPSHYYIQFHEKSVEYPEFHNAIRGQFEKT